MEALKLKIHWKGVNDVVDGVIKVQFEFHDGTHFGTEVEIPNAVTILQEWIDGKNSIDADMYVVYSSDIKEIKFFK